MDAEKMVEFVMANNADCISEKFPLSSPLIAQMQQKDKLLLKKAREDKNPINMTLFKLKE